MSKSYRPTESLSSDIHLLGDLLGQVIRRQGGVELFELEERIRARGVRVDERLALLRALAEPEGADGLRRRIESSKRRIAAAASQVRGALR